MWGWRWALPTAQFHTDFQVLGVDLQEHEFMEWLQADNNDNGYRHYSDDEIVSEVMPALLWDRDKADDDNNGDVMVTEQTVISHATAMDMWSLKWQQQQDETNVYNTNQCTARDGYQKKIKWTIAHISTYKFSDSIYM